MCKKLYLLDGHSLAHRAFYALPLLQNSSGEYTNAVFGFARMLFKLLDDEKPDYIMVAFDKKAPTFRHEEFMEYKANRKKMPEELGPQIGLIKELLEALKIPIVALDGYEADDVIGTLARRGEKEGYKVRIVTGDRDSLQLVNEQTSVLYTRKGITDIERYDLKKVRERYGLEPEQLIDMKGLMGDNSDNIPGVPGIGEKTAITLLQEFSSLENILENIEQVSGIKRRENLQEYAEQARMSKRLGRIKLDVPIKLNFEDCRLEEPEQKEIVSLLKRLEFSSLLDRFITADELFDIIEDEPEIKVIKDQRELEELISQIKKTGEMALDIPLDNYKQPVRASYQEILIALRDKGVYSLSLIEKENGFNTEEVFALLKPILNDEGIKKNLLHAKETIIVLKRKEIELNGLVFDPLLAVYLLNPSDNLPSLEELLKQELNLILPEEIKERQKIAFFLSNLFEIKDKLLPELEKREILELYREIELPLIKPLAEMELNGITVDIYYLEDLSLQWEKELDTLTDSIYSYAGREFNINSPKQLGEILFEELGLPVIKKTKTGYSTSAEVLEELADKHDIIGEILNYRQLMKLKSTYVDALPPLINPETGRIHTSFNQMVTATGRLSSTDPNLQNIPIRTEEGREIRKAFIPEEGWLLLSIDYSQIELRVLAHISKDESLITAFNNGEDIHTQTASEIFNVEPQEVTANMRRQAKVINFGIAYGMSPYGLARDLGISRKAAEEYIERYFNRFSGVKKYMVRVIEQAKQEGYVTTIMKRRRYIPEIRSRNYHRRSFAERTAINTPIQGSAADIMKAAMIRIYKRLKEDDFKARLLLQVHDELVIEVSKDNLTRVAEVVKKEMEEAVLLDVPLIADVQVGKNWRDKEDYPGVN
jgi:DNA polymerase-1